MGPRSFACSTRLAPIFAILIAAGWFASRAWLSVQGPPMPVDGYIAMTLGIVFSLIVGCESASWTRREAGGGFFLA